VVHPAFRRQLPLLVAHLALLALVLLAGFGRLASLDGRFELTQGVPFDGRLIEQQAGALHPGTLPGLQFRHDGFEIDYAPGRKRGPTRNRVTWIAADGRPQSATIGDHKPLVLGLPCLHQPEQGLRTAAALAPGARRGGDGRGAPAELSDARTAAVARMAAARRPQRLGDAAVRRNPARPAGRRQLQLPERHKLVLRLGEQRFELAPGEGAAVDGGTLVYEGLRTWMGYRVAYDPTLPWLLAAALLSALSLGWHYLRKFSAAARPVALPQGARAGAVDG
jgi:hypothetical protein